ncbi:MAG TPA: glutamine--tRNA ligase/YqeY domain fusion protein [Chloroflexi bacterium]|nr:glutamine--tRNA ligase/YqeY domain fusion protein [Chloroflexota bacterium]
MTQEEMTSKNNFIWEMIEEDNRTNRFSGVVHTRFPPEPNGQLHIGHAKAIYIDFETARRFGGQCNLRMDDTNPTKEDTDYVDAIQRDIKWLGYDWDDRFYYASSYFGQLYEYAVILIKKGLAYVCDLTAEEMREYRGTLTEPGKESPYRYRSVEENLDLFMRMKEGEFPEGKRTLRAKIDMTSPNLNMRDPVVYRIMFAEHHQTGDEWCIYPMYDFAHPLSDSIEGITHSLCSLEFEDHRPLYDWYCESVGVHHPQQIEFARLNLTYTVMSKRKLLQLVTQGYVSGWDDPRMPTLSGLRRRGYTPEAIKQFIEDNGIAKNNTIADISRLEFNLRQDLEARSPRAMAVLDPVKVVIENYPEDKEEMFEVPLYTQDETRTESREIPFSRELYIEREDFMEDPPRKYFRLSPGQEVRLFKAYYITCTDVVKNDEGEIVEIWATYDPESRGGMSADGRRVKGTLHWVSARHAIDAEVRLYDRLFAEENPDDVEEGKTFLDYLNPESLSVITAKVEPHLVQAQEEIAYQFMRKGYFIVDPDSTREHLVFNRAVALRDSWAKMAQSG